MTFFRRIVFLSLLLYSFQSNAQSFGFDISTSLALNLMDNILPVHLNASVGHGVSDQDIFFGGVQLSMYGLSTDEEEVEDESIFSIELFGGYHHLFALSSTKDEWGEVISEWGICTEVRLYFNPLVPRKYEYENDAGEMINVKGDYDVQLGYGIRIGWYKESWEKSDRYWSLWMEFNTNDPYKILRTLEIPEVDEGLFPSRSRIAFGLSLFIW
ncbi:MAG: hypothetical protein OCD76_12490 [Reichenbachiella sp.]